MKCKNHPNRDAEQFCASCGIPICSNCTEESRPGQFYCFQCAMLQTVSVAGTSLGDKRDRAKERELGKKKREWGPFHYFVIVSSVLIVVMWGVIIFGGTKSPGKKIDFTNNPRALLFLVNSSIKRYAHFEGNKYPMNLMDIIPKYLPLSKEDLVHLKSLSYRNDPLEGYRLSFANPKPGDMNIIISSKGVEYKSVIKEETGND
ncbi:B-box zinc finger protein [Thermodesulfobacteriota bacterium]